MIGVDDEQYGQRLAAFVVLNVGASATPDVLKAARPRELGELQSAQGDHDPRRTTSQQHRQDRAPRVAGPRGPCVGAGRCCAPRRSCSTRPTACAHSAARATSPLRCSRSAGRRPRCHRCISLGRCSTRCAVVCAATSAAPAAESRWCSPRSPGLLWLIYRRNVASKPYFEEPLRESLGDDYAVIAAQSLFILHGEDDSIIPVPEGREFAEAMRNSSDVRRRIRRDPARSARVRLLLRVTARTLHRSGGGGIPVLGARRCAHHQLMKRPLLHSFFDDRQ